MPVSLLVRSIAPALAASGLAGAMIVGGVAAAQPAQKPPAPAAQASAPGEDALPEIDLSGRILFQIMAAEVALQRGETGAAFKTYMNLAQETRDPRMARRATEIALTARAGKEALEAVEFWRQLAPRSTEAAEALTSIDLGLGRYDEAFPVIAELLSRSDKPAEVIQRTQRQLARASDPARAFALLERLSTPYPRDAEVRLALAAGAQAAGLKDRAASEARAALELAPDSQRAALAAAQFVHGDDPKAAAALLADFLRRHPDAIELRLAYARLLVASERFAEAREQFVALQKAAPRNPELLFALGTLSTQGKLYAEARAQFMAYLALIEQAEDGRQRDPDGAYLNLAQIAEEEKRYDEALGWLAKIDDGEQFVGARMREAFILAKTEKLDEARRRLREVQTGDPQERSQLVLAEAQLLRDARRSEEALAVLDAALAQSPEDTALLYDAAMTAERLDRIERMEELLRRLIKLKPEAAHAYNALGYSLADRKLRLPEARALIEQALKIAPNDAFILDSMGWVLYRQGDLAGARQYLERAHKLRPEAEVSIHLAEVLWAQGEHEAARRLLRQVRAAEPGNELLKSTLARLKISL